MPQSEKIVYRLNSSVLVSENNGYYYVRKNGHLLGTYTSLEKALDSQRY